MNKTFIRMTFALLAVAYVLSHFTGHAHAQSSLGIGANDAIVPSTGMFSGLMIWINQHQQTFYRSLSTAMKALRDDGGQVWMLVGLSFAYGVFHAAGPGHGKAVISSYMLANEVALRRGVVLSFISAFLQAATAIIVMLLAYFVLRGTSVSMTNAAHFLEIASYVFITGFGAWLLWKKAGPLVKRMIGAAPAHSLSAASAPHAHHVHGDGHEHHHHEGHCDHGHHNHDHAHHHDEGMMCSSCGHSHAVDPSLLSTERFDWRTAWSAMAAVGLRPCSGALIVLSFALLNGLWVAGILSVLAMALGTAITVSTLAVLAVTAKNWAVLLAGGGRLGNRIHTAIEIGAAAFIFLVGVTLLSASLSM
ncbi:nickel/cobalt transporter [Aquamicrobium ahrensii]|uniref:Nickel/cobalt efflux system n=1 Tax=Aquamicrobium ahrensii TaxID=469551 RepID=A0ABV2KLF8_9HYPH